MKGIQLIVLTVVGGLLVKLLEPLVPVATRVIMSQLHMPVVTHAMSSSTQSPPGSSLGVQAVPSDTGTVDQIGPNRVPQECNLPTLGAGNDPRTGSRNSRKLETSVDRIIRGWTDPNRRYP